jgi:3-oxoacyl-[acyl-carrier-protein] synthase-3
MVASEREITMQNVAFYLTDFSVYIPENKRSIAQLIQQIQKTGYTTKDEADYTERGIFYAPVEEERSWEEMIEQVVTPVLARCATTGQRIGQIWLVQSSLKLWHERNPVKGLLKKWELEHLPLFTLEEYFCASYHAVLQMAPGFFSLHPDEALLLIVADKGMHPSCRLNDYVMFGDSASACLFTLQGGKHKIWTICNQIDGVVYDDEDHEGLSSLGTTFYLGIRKVFQDVLRKSGIPLEQIRQVIGTNVDQPMWDMVGQICGIPTDRVYQATLSETGHLYSTDVIYNVQHAIQNGLLKPGDYYLTFSLGFGGVYGCALQQVVEEEQGGR